MFIKRRAPEQQAERKDFLRAFEIPPVNLDLLRSDERDAAIAACPRHRDKVPAGGLGVLYNVAVGTKPLIKCVGTDSAISWNQTGPQGLAGAQGPSGAPGAQGSAGPAGAAGNGDITASAVFLAAHVCYGADLSGLQFHGVMTAGLARNCIFDNADLSGATMTGVEFHGSFENATLNNAVFDNSSLGSDFKNAKAIGASFASVWFAGDYTGADFTGAILKGAHIGGVDFSGVNFTGADLRGSGNEMGQHTWDTWMVTTSATTIWSNTLCSDGTNSDNPANNGTCVGHRPRSESEPVNRSKGHLARKASSVLRTQIRPEPDWHRG